MAARKVKVGDRVSYHGNWPGSARYEEHGPFEVTRIEGNKVIFANADRFVGGLLGDLQWLEEDGAWHLPGCMLHADQVARYQELTKQDPPHDRVLARKMLLVLEAAEV